MEAIELRFYDPSAGVDSDGVPNVITRVVTVNLPPPAEPNRYARWATEERAQAFADLLASLCDDPEVPA
jgi:hypothetical protein